MKRIMMLLTILVCSFVVAACSTTNDNPPTITILSSFDTEYLEGSEEPNWLQAVTVNCEVDGDINITENNVDTSAVDMNTVGTFDVIYEVKNSKGLTATKTLTITILEVPSTPIKVPSTPIITINPDFEIDYLIGSTEPNWLEAVTVYDEVDGEITLINEHIDTIYVDMDTIGTFSVIFKVVNSLGISATETLTITIFGPQGVFDDRILVGNTVSTTGSLAPVGVPFKAGMEAYFKMVNANGGVAGRRIDYIQYDDQFDPAMGLTYTQKLVEDDQVFALVGHFGTPTVGATHEYLNKYGIPRIYYASGISQLFDPNASGGARASFPVQPIYDGEGEYMVARAVKDLGASSIGVIYSNTDDGRGLLNGITLKANELNIPLKIIQVPQATIDMEMAAQVLVGENVDVILVAANQAHAKTAINALYDVDNTIPVITSYLNADFIWLSGVSWAIESFDIYASSWIDMLTQEEDFVLFFENIPQEYAANPFAFAGWLAAATFVEGLNRVGDGLLTWESYIEAMEETPLALPFSVIVDYRDGRRVGTQAMALLKATLVNGEYIWETVKPIESIEDILSK